MIAMADTTIPQAVGPMLDQVSTLVDSIPKDKLSGLLDESFKAFNGAGYDLGSLLDSSAKITGDLNKVSRPVDGARRRQRAASRFAGTDRRLAPAVGTEPGRDHGSGRRQRPAGAHAPAGGARPRRTRCLGCSIRSSRRCRILLANLTTFGQIAVTYHPSLEQVLVLLPPFVGDVLVLGSREQPDGTPAGRLQHSRSKTARRARSGSCRRRSGARRPT